MTFTKDPRLRLLISYHYYQDADLEKEFLKGWKEKPEIYADSGAVSALTMGVKLDLDDYARWLKQWAHVIDFYANLDVIGSAVKSKVNLDKLRDQGLDPMPVYHGGEPFSYFKEMVDECPFVAVGGVAWTPTRSPQMTRIFIKIFRTAGKTALHGFGMTDTVTLGRFPWYSTDSSSWLAGFIYGRMRMWVEKDTKFSTLVLRDPKSCSALADSLSKDYGVSWREFAFGEEYSGPVDLMSRVSILSVKKCEMWLRRSFGKIYIPGREHLGPGPKMFLAVTPPSLKKYMRDPDMETQVLEYFEKERPVAW